ncbi:MAG: metallophosphoesterase family protein [Acidobacteriota bacterium]
MLLIVLSDTHGLLRDSVLPHLEGADQILHAGDVGDPAILERLGSFAPTLAVRGNVDHAPGVAELPATLETSFAGVDVRMTHRRADVPDAWLRTRATTLIVFGHSHRPELDWHGNDTLLLNPGAIGARRFRLPLTLARIRLDNGRIVPELVAIED